MPPTRARLLLTGGTVFIGTTVPVTKENHLGVRCVTAGYQPWLTSTDVLDLGGEPTSSPQAPRQEHVKVFSPRISAIQEIRAVFPAQANVVRLQPSPAVPGAPADASRGPRRSLGRPGAC